MKKVFITRLIGLLALLVDLPVYAYDFESGGIYYNIDGDNTVYVTSGDMKYSGDVIISEEASYNGKKYSVTSIGTWAFDSCYGMTSISIPSSITSIQMSAFEDCNRLSSVYITDLDAWCKMSLSGEANPLFYAHHLYLNGKEIKDLVIPTSVTSIGSYAFRNCENLISITIPSSVTSIGSSAFEGTAWYDNQPDGLVFAGKFAYKYKGEMPANSSISLQEGTIGIAGSAFYNCSSLTSITIPNSVISIGNSAFSGCSGLTSVTIPNSVTSIGGDSFYGCSGLTSITIPNSVTSIGNWAFSGCSGLTSITIPNSVTSFGYSAFLGCKGLTTITSEIEKPFEIDSGTFSDDIYNVAELIVPYGTKAAYQNTVGWNKFTKITEAEFEVSEFSVNGIYYKVGDNNTVSVTSGEVKYSDDVVIPEQVTYNNGTYNVTTINPAAFWECSGLTSITIPKSLNRIKEDAFFECNNLTAVNISDLEAWLNVSIQPGSRRVGDSYFDCSGSPLYYAHHLYLNGVEVKEIEIPKTIDRIPNFSYEGWSGLNSVIIPNSVTSIGYSAFSGCGGLTRIVLDKEEPLDIYSNTFSDDTYTNAELIVPKGTKALYQATEGWNKFAKITEAEEDSNEFELDGIYYVKFGDNKVAVIKGSNEYSGDVVIPSQVTYKGQTYSVTIIESAFEGCANLTSVAIPNSVIFIYLYAFEGCDNLKSVYISDLESWCNVKFEYGFPNEFNSSNPLQQAHHLFLNGVEVKDLVIPQSITEIKYATFDGCSSLTSVAFPESVTSIGWGAFEGCTGLTSLLFPNSLTSIGDYAFYGCSGLLSIKIPNSVTSIGIGTFQGCSGLTTITSEIVKPFVINSYIFSDDTYTNAELIVPKGTKALYQATEGWNKFTKITEAGDKDEVAFAIDGISYQGSKSEKNVVVKSVDASKTWMEIPASVSYDGITYQVAGIDNDVFKGSSMAALIWDVEAVLPNNAFSNALIGSNFLLYVKSSSYAPSSVKNVVVNGTAQTIALSDDGGQFYCPQTFTARSISYTHNYSMETDIGKAKGWETLALPFDVQKILHSTRGEIVPFPSYNSSSTQKPFWLANFSGYGFRRTAAVLANEPYIIAMPNSSSYRNEYNLAGDVTFSADNVQVPKTPTFGGTFVPAFATVAKSSSVYALNVNNRNVKYSGSYDAGSRFISGLRDVRLFEAYMTGSSSRGIVEINFDDGTTDIEAILLTADDCQEMTIHTLSGQQVTRTTKHDFGQVWDNLPKGVYIVNGKKKIK